MSWRIVACLCLLIALPVRAEPAAPLAPAPDSAASELDDPDALLREALAAYAAEDLARARVLFEEVHRARPSARTLRALGVLAFREGRFSEAVSLLEQSLASPVKPLTDELARGASELLGQARVLAQAKAAPLAPPPEVELAPRIEPQRVVDPGGAQQPHAATALLRPGPDLRRLRRTSYALYALAGAGAVVAVVATALGVERVDRIEDRCRESATESCTPERAQELARSEKLSLLSALSIGGTVLGSLTGASAVTLSIWLRGRADAPASAPLQGLSLQVGRQF